jgi:hypothetical protein
MRHSLLLLPLLLMAGTAQAETWNLASPDGQISVTVDKADGGLPKYSVSYHGKRVIAPSELDRVEAALSFGRKIIEKEGINITFLQSYNL